MSGRRRLHDAHGREPDQLTSGTINKPSDGSERSVTNQVFLVADGTAQAES
ncbi:MAG: hypothetical protein V8R75_05395 [Oscillospiraceae bacterium]